MSINPKVFISHASEDKERFVIKFAEKLRKDGIDAWLDKWEIIPGDSLVKKIFDEGLKNSDTVIVVISKYSVQKEWVKEELDSAVYKKIEGKCRIIPVVLEECEVPPALEHTFWVRIKDLDFYDNDYEEIRSTIFGESKKPPLGTPPTYLTSSKLCINEFSYMDNYICDIICKRVLEDQYPIFVNTSDVLPTIIESGISKQDFLDTIEILDSGGYLGAEWSMGDDKPFALKISPKLLEIYCINCIEGYNEMKLSVISSIVNESIFENGEIANKTGIQKSIITQILNFLEFEGLIRTTTAMGGVVLIHPNNLAKLRRFMKESS